MNLYTAEQIREWDAFTITHEPVASIELMERAATRCTAWLLEQFGSNRHIVIVCGKGNNGGDGLAIARLLHSKGVRTTTYILEFGHLGSADFQVNLQKLHEQHQQPFFIQGALSFPLIEQGDIVVDALYGSGLNRPLDGWAAQLVQHLNEKAETIVSIDVPSGLLLNESSVENTVIHARYTLSFQATKMAFLLPENEAFVGEVQVLDIGLHQGYSAVAPYTLLTPQVLQPMFKPRSRFGHKGSFGHVLLVGGSQGKTGAMVLCARAALRAGAGLVTVLVPRVGYYVLQTAFPEAMCLTDEGDDKLTSLTLDVSRYTTIGIGPGMGTNPETQKAFSAFIARQEYPLVLDADALNCLAQQPALLSTLPKGSILTPHPKEFERLFGPSANDFDQVERACQMARQFGCFIVLKGHHTLVATPEGNAYFNNTGNAGMATGGAGDVLTGILSALLAQGYSSLEACLLGVYLHGLAGDAAASKLSPEAVIASDIIDHLGEAFRQLPAGEARRPGNQTVWAG